MRHVPKSPAFNLPGRKPIVEVVDEIMVPILREKTAAERVDMAADMWRFARDIQIDFVRNQHPDWTAERIQREAACRLSGQQDSSCPTRNIDLCRSTRPAMQWTDVLNEAAAKF